MSLTALYNTVINSFPTVFSSTRSASEADDTDKKIAVLAVATFSLLAYFLWSPHKKTIPPAIPKLNAEEEPPIQETIDRLPSIDKQPIDEVIPSDPPPEQPVDFLHENPIDDSDLVLPEDEEETDEENPLSKSSYCLVNSEKGPG